MRWNDAVNAMAIQLILHLLRECLGSLSISYRSSVLFVKRCFGPGRLQKYVVAKRPSCTASECGDPYIICKIYQVSVNQCRTKYGGAVYLPVTEALT